MPSNPEDMNEKPPTFPDLPSQHKLLLEGGLRKKWRDF
jgi:hypothetical protein